ncbi:hypothetical protein LJC42_02070 [Eubacteriales bacterium OttesenSCG-928-K08]|nr:hypothetical protein [Eubacteriales bacterium OttesenSCG-928-K08]
MHEGHRERFRARYIENGLSGFAEHEILELLLTYVIPRRDTNAPAHALIHKFGSLEATFNADVKDLMLVDGIGERAAVFLRMQGDIHGLLRRMDGQNNAVLLTTPAQAAPYAIGLLKSEQYESVYVASLNKNRLLLGAERLYSGTLTEAPLYPRRVVESALRHRAHSVLLLHNHPSGDPSPSDDDLIATNAIRNALNSIAIQMFDHIIVGNNVIYSCFIEKFIDQNKQVYTTYKEYLNDLRTS